MPASTLIELAGIATAAALTMGYGLWKESQEQNTAIATLSQGGGEPAHIVPLRRGGVCYVTKSTKPACQ